MKSDYHWPWSVISVWHRQCIILSIAAFFLIFKARKKNPIINFANNFNGSFFIVPLFYFPSVLYFSFGLKIKCIYAVPIQISWIQNQSKTIKFTCLRFSFFVESSLPIKFFCSSSLHLYQKERKKINFIILCNISLAFSNERKLTYNFCLVEFGECDFKITFKR